MKPFILFVLILIVSHLVHSYLNRLFSPNYNTVFSSVEVSYAFYNLKIGQNKKTVDGLIGLPFYCSNGRCYYSKPGNNLIMKNTWSAYTIDFKQDTVFDFNVFYDD